MIAYYRMHTDDNQCHAAKIKSIFNNCVKLTQKNKEVMTCQTLTNVHLSMILDTLPQKNKMLSK